MTVDEVVDFGKRRWLIVVIIVGVVCLAAGLVAVRARAHRPYQATGELFVSAPLPSGPSGGKPGAAAGLVAQDLAAVLGSRLAALDMAGYLHSHGYRGVSVTDVQGDLSASNSHRAVNISVSAATAGQANATVRAALRAGTQGRARYLGPVEARAATVRVVSTPDAQRVSSKSILESFAVRVIIGIVLALAIAMAYDFIDDRVRRPEDLETWLGAPTLARLI